MTLHRLPDTYRMPRPSAAEERLIAEGRDAPAAFAAGRTDVHYMTRLHMRLRDAAAATRDPYLLQVFEACRFEVFLAISDSVGKAAAVEAA